MKKYLLGIAFSCYLGFLSAAPDVRWMDSTVAEPPQGKLISDNLGYYGDVVLTGATYEYLTPIKADRGDGKGDTDKVYAGKRLQDGDLNGNPENNNFYGDPNRSPLLESPAVIIFDFKKSCDLVETDLKLQEGKYDFRLESSPDKKAWQKVYEDKELKVAANKIVRVKLPAKTAGQYLKFSLKGSGNFWLSEIYVWGNCLQNEATYKNLNNSAVYDTFVAPSIPGIMNCQTDDIKFNRWKKQLAALIRPLPQVVCSQLPSWNVLTKNSILPEANKVDKPVSLTMVRNETEPFCVALTNTDYYDAVATEANLSAFTGIDGKACPQITGEIYVMGAMVTRDFGVQMIPMFSAANKPGRDIIRKYCTNGVGIMDFPKLTLSQAGSAILWIKVKTDNCAPGNYTAKLTVKNGMSVAVKVNVINVTLKDVKRFVNFWAKTIDQYPFRPLTWVEKDVDARLEIGMTVAPYEISDRDLDPDSLNNVLRRRQPNTLFGLWMGSYGGKLYAVGQYGDAWGKNGLQPTDVAAIKNDINGIAAFAKSRGLDYQHWYLDTADETNSKNLKIFGEVMKTAKEAQPEMMIICNPCGWQPDPKHPFESDDLLYGTMKDWYNKYIDISVPASTLTTYEKCGNLFGAPRKFNALYEVVTHRAKSESYECVTMPRYIVWQSIKRNYNGWCMFAYQSAINNPWDDLDSSNDFCLVLPGPCGPIPTREFEAAREGYEDFMLMLQLKNKNRKVYREVITDFENGIEFDAIRTKIYQALSH